MKKMQWTKVVPGPLVAVVWGVLANSLLFKLVMPEYLLTGKHMVTLPASGTISGFIDNLTFPDFAQLGNVDVYIAAFTIAIVASLESLLSLDATDKLDPYKRIAPQSRELQAQGVGNMVSGLIGGLPVTAVIVRSTANVSSGAKTKVSAIFHGFLLAISVIFFPHVLNLIPLAALAAVLLTVGYKLTKPALYKDMYQKGFNQFIPFIVTILAILFTDLLIGITIGIIVGLFFVIRTNLHQSITVVKPDSKQYLIRLEKDVSFLNKAFLRKTLQSIPEGSRVVVDETDSIFIDQDILETIEDFRATAENKDISLEIRKAKNTKNTKFAEVL